jgi:hypothetical protein
MAKLISNRQIKTYQKTTDALRESLGRTIQVYMGDPVPSANWDTVNNEPIDPNEEVVYDWDIKTIDDVSIRWFNKDEFEWLPGGRIENGDCKIKCKLGDVLASGSDPNNKTIFHLAEKVIVDGETCKVMKPPRKTGLKTLYSVEVVLERVEPFG